MELTGDSWHPGRSHKGGEKRFCCVTTRRRNLWVFNGLGRSFDSLTALAFGPCVLAFGLGVLAMFGLPPRRLPLADLAETFRLLAVALVPAPRLVLPSAASAQAHPRPRAASTGTTTALWLIVAGAHGSQYLPRDSPGRTCYRSSRALVQIVALRPTSASLPSPE